MATGIRYRGWKIRLKRFLCLSPNRQWWAMAHTRVRQHFSIECTGHPNPDSALASAREAIDDEIEYGDDDL